MNKSNLINDQNRPDSSIPDLNQIYFYLTEGCNLKCRHCWLSPKYDADGTHLKTLDIELFQSIIQEAKPLGLKTIKLTGGEPLLHPHINKLLDITLREELGVIIETNGWLCTQKIAEKISKLTDRFVSVSLDGADSETHDLIRGISGSFEKAKKAIQNLSKAGIAPQIIMTLMHYNAGQLEKMVRLAEKLGASSLKFNLLQPITRGETLHKNKTALLLEELIRLGYYVENDLQKTTELTLFYDHPPAFQKLSRIYRGNGICGIKGIMGVISSGHYALCGIGSHVKDLVFGLAGENRLGDVWRNNSILNEIRTGLPERIGGVCSRCLMKYYCFGACLAQSYYRGRSLWLPFWFCDAAEKKGFFPKNRMSTSNHEGSHRKN